MKTLYLTSIFAFFAFSLFAQTPTPIDSSGFPAHNDSTRIYQYDMPITETFTDSTSANDSLTVFRGMQKSMEAASDNILSPVINNSGNVDWELVTFYYTFNHDWTKLWVTPNQYIPGNSDFPDANLVYYKDLNGHPTYNYYLLNSTGFYELGSRDNSSSPVTIKNSPYKPSAIFNLDYNNPNNITDFLDTSTAYSSSGNMYTYSKYSVDVDAYGTFTITTGSSTNPTHIVYDNCLRTRTLSIDTMDAGSGMLFYIKSLIYTWYAPGISEPISVISFAQVRNNLDPALWPYDPQFAWHDESDFYYAQPFTGVNISKNDYIKYIKIFPNPANANVTVASHFNNIDKIIVRDLSGREVKTFDNLNSKIAKINVSDISKGMYLLDIISGNKSTTKKLNIVK